MRALIGFHTFLSAVCEDDTEIAIQILKEYPEFLNLTLEKFETLHEAGHWTNSTPNDHLTKILKAMHT